MYCFFTKIGNTYGVKYLVLPDSFDGGVVVIVGRVGLLVTIIT